MSITGRSLPVTNSAAVLQILSCGPSYAGALTRHISDFTENQTKLSGGSIHYAVAVLKHAGLITEKTTEVDHRSKLDHGRPRVYYQITDLGRTVAAENRELIAKLFDLASSPGDTCESES